MEQEIFKRSKIIPDKLLKYGFKKDKNKYIYRKAILDNNLEIIIIYESGIIKGKIIDTELNEEYLNYRIEHQIGEFVNSVRDEFINLLEDIKNNCCIIKNYVYDQSNRIASLIKDKYGDTPEYLWDDDKNSVFRNKINKKWYGIIMSINKEKLDNEDKMIEIMNVKLPKEKIDKLVEQPGYYRAYHMNKKYWITFILDDTLSDDKIMSLIDESYNYTREVNEWVIPANPNFWDVINCFNNTTIIEWKQPLNIKINDIVYLYVGSPYSCILYKCKVIKKDIVSPYPWAKQLMKIELIKKYPTDKYTFNIVKQYDLKAIRGARRMPVNLINKMKEDEDND